MRGPAVRHTDMPIPAEFTPEHFLPAMREALHNEVHARPPEALLAPVAVTHRVMLVGADERAASREHLNQLLAGRGLAPVAADTLTQKGTL